MTQKEKQAQINAEVDAAYERMYAAVGYFYKYPCKRLRSCSASVYTAPGYKILRSYNTIIACIDTNTGILYDFLRKVYGYTATSAQHVAKFAHDYAAQDGRTWRDI